MKDYPSKDKFNELVSKYSFDEIKNTEQTDNPEYDPDKSTIHTRRAYKKFKIFVARFWQRKFVFNINTGFV